MDRGEYTAQVLSQLRRVTEEERQAIQTEINGHIEDHIDALLDLGYPEEEAEARTLSAMGDPAEVGRELDKQYPPGWLWAGWLAELLAMLMIMPLFWSMVLMEGSLSSCIEARMPMYAYDPGRMEQVEAQQVVDIRQTAGRDVIHICRVTVGESIYRPGERRAQVGVVAYDRIPFGQVSRWVSWDHIYLEDQRGDNRCPYSPVASRDSRVEYMWGSVPLQPEDTYVTLGCDRPETSFSIRIPLPKEETP